MILPLARASAAAHAQPPSRPAQLSSLPRLYATASPSPSSPPSEAAKQQDGAGKPWQINLLYDSDCPLCMKEVDFLRKRDVEGACVYMHIYMCVCDQGVRGVVLGMVMKESLSRHPSNP